MQSQTISVPMVFSQVNIPMGKYSQPNSSAKSSNTKTTTTTSFISTPPVQTIYRKYNNNSVYMSVSSSSSKKTTTTTRISNNNNSSNRNNNGNNVAPAAYIVGVSKYLKNCNNAFDVQFLVSLFSVFFKYIFIITINILDKLIFIVLNPVETLLFLSYKISEIRAMKSQVEELKNEKAQLVNQSEQLMVQLNCCRIINRNVETSYRAMKQKRDILKETNKAIQNELQRERESRFVVEKCHSERIEKLEFEIDMKDQELMQYEDKERLLKKKIHKLKKKLKKANTSSSSVTLPTFSLQNFNTFTFDEPLPSNDDEKGITKSEGDDISYSESEDGNFVFAKDSDAESCTDSSSADELDSESESESESESDSNSESESESESDSDYDSDIDNLCNLNSHGIPKDSIYYDLGRHQNDPKEEEEEELESTNKIEQNPLSAMRQEAYNCLYQSLISELCSSSILMDLDVKLDKNNINSYTCINIILEAIINYLEAKNQLINTKAIDEIFVRYRPLILNYTDTEEDQMNLLVSLENICIENSLRLQQHLRILMAIYKAELVEPNIIIKWYHLLPESEESTHSSCPMTPSVHCVFPKLPINSSNVRTKSYSFSEGDCKSFGQMIDGHYATNTIQRSLDDNATINFKSEGIENVNINTKINGKALQNSYFQTDDSIDNINKALSLTTKNKSKNNSRGGHARTASGSILRGRRRSLSGNASDFSHEIYYLKLRKNIRELAKVFALWLESKESSSSDEESILDNMSMSQDFESDSEDGGISSELRRIHRKLLSDEDSCDTNSNSNDIEDDEISETGSIDSYNSDSPKSSDVALKKCCKRVTFNLGHMDDKDEDETINNDEEEINNDEEKVNNENTKMNENKERSTSLYSCLEKNPLSFNQFDFDEDTEGESGEEEEEVIEEVEEVIEEEIVEEEIIEENVNENEENDDEDDESITIVEEKEEVIDEVVECIKVNC